MKSTMTENNVENKTPWMRSITFQKLYEIKKNELDTYEGNNRRKQDYQNVMQATKKNYKR
eukprot:6056859-Amphidinium_carterae.1